MLGGMDLAIVFWLVLLVAFLIVEFVTVGLTSIWFAAGSLVSLILAICQMNFGFQAVAFFVVSIGLLVATKPFVDKYINSRIKKTNVDEMLGVVVRIVERVSNMDQTGKAVVRDIEWTVRTEDDKEILEVGEKAYVTAISGVKLIVKRYEED